MSRGTIRMALSPCAILHIWGFLLLMPLCSGGADGGAAPHSLPVHRALDRREGGQKMHVLSNLLDHCLGRVKVDTQDRGGGRWTVTLRFPRNDSSIEFKYVLLPSGRGGMKNNGSVPAAIWEEGLNRGVSITSQGQAEISHGAQLPHHFRHAYNVAPPLVDVDFRVHHNLKWPFRFIAVIGADQVLGQWNVLQAVHMSKLGKVDKQGFNIWQVTVTLPIPSMSEFKFITARSPNGRGALAWEGGPNRFIRVSREGHVTFVPADSALKDTVPTTASECSMLLAPPASVSISTC